MSLLEIQDKVESSFLFFWTGSEDILKVFHILFIILIFVVYQFISLGDTQPPFGVGVKETSHKGTLIEEYGWKGQTVHQSYINDRSLDEKTEVLTSVWIKERQIKNTYASVVSLLLLLSYFPLFALFKMKFNIKEETSTFSPLWNWVFFIGTAGMYTAVIIGVFVQYQELLQETHRLLAELDPLMKKQ
ncbi:hypothetical protein [Halobacillus litoralis]|uniref:hypothetical protein n=1 Tax=Halobacillus litoralis TaxID=45668 RepID=UPI001371EBF5|nr:hypothetical protein [Halobacillus litoralis]MYL37016.1 hypothetical protein [Halobacillus litoralis]